VRCLHACTSALPPFDRCANQQSTRTQLRHSQHTAVSASGEMAMADGDAHAGRSAPHTVPLRGHKHSPSTQDHRLGSHIMRACTLQYDKTCFYTPQRSPQPWHTGWAEWDRTWVAGFEVRSFTIGGILAHPHLLADKARTDGLSTERISVDGGSRPMGSQPNTCWSWPKRGHAAALLLRSTSFKVR
jgi:hypothetical protein